MGGGVSVFVSANPLGPFSPTAYDIGCNRSSSSRRRGSSTGFGGSGAHPHDTTPAANPETCASSVGFFSNSSAFPAMGWSGAQQNGVHEVLTAHGRQLLWTGDRWYSAPDALKGHDLQFWAPLSWGPPDPAAFFPQAPVLQHIGNPVEFALDMPRW